MRHHTLRTTHDGVTTLRVHDGTAEVRTYDGTAAVRTHGGRPNATCDTSEGT